MELLFNGINLWNLRGRMSMSLMEIEYMHQVRQYETNLMIHDSWIHEQSKQKNTVACMMRHQEC